MRVNDTNWSGKPLSVYQVSVGSNGAGDTRWPSFNPGAVYGGGRFVVTDVDGRLWQVDAESATARTVWIGEKPKRGKYDKIDAAAVINEICERRGISRKRLCESINTKTSTLQRLMSGSTKSLNLTTYNKIVAWDNSQP